MLKYKKFILWWLSVLLILTGVFWSFHFGLITLIWNTDITYITSIIAILFTTASCSLGWIAFKQSDLAFAVVNKSAVVKVYDTSWFLSEILMALGMLGTVIGLIYMLATSFVGSDPSQMQTQLGDMWKHMGLALYTNAVGIVGSIVLKLQVYFIGYDVDET